MIIFNFRIIAGYCVSVFITTCPFRQVKHKFFFFTYLSDLFTCPPKEKILYFVLKVACPQYAFTNVACPIWATLISWSFKMFVRIWLLLALGNRASAYVAPCIDNGKEKIIITITTNNGVKHANRFKITQRKHKTYHNINSEDGVVQHLDLERHQLPLLLWGGHVSPQRHPVWPTGAVRVCGGGGGAVPAVGVRGLAVAESLAAEARVVEPTLCVGYLRQGHGVPRLDYGRRWCWFSARPSSLIVAHPTRSGHERAGFEDRSWKLARCSLYEAKA